MLTWGVSRHGERPFFDDGKLRRTHIEFLTDVMICLSALRDLQLARGARIALWGGKSYRYLATLTAVLGSEYIVVPINSILKPTQVEHILRDAAPDLLIADISLMASLRPQALAVIRHKFVLPLAGAQAAAGDSLFHWGGQDQWTAPDVTVPTSMQRGLHGAGVTDHDPCCILYTSGSTGLPKGVVLSHRNLVSGALSVADYLALTTDDVVLGLLPLSFDAGLSQLTTSIAAGCKFVPLNYLVPQEVPKTCRVHGVTSITAVPPLWIQLLRARWDEASTAPLRRFANTGGRLPDSVLTSLRQLFPAARPFLMYGLTEAFRSTCLDPDEVDARTGSIGKAVPNAQVLVVRPDGTECAPGEAGELVHRGAFVTLGYWNQPELTALRYRPVPRQHPALGLTERAVWSGDIVRKDADGFLYFVGRGDEMIKTMGYRVSPSEVEEVIYAADLVREVAVFGQDDFERGQRIVAMVVLKHSEPPPQEALRRHCTQQLPGYMCPAEYIVVASLARNPNGKLDRAVLKAALQQGVAAGAQGGWLNNNMKKESANA
jgi:acyl-CoA ligase (AMP-forming) (exosortase A-associated)